jgi:hypothetical protein
LYTISFPFHDDDGIVRQLVVKTISHDLLELLEKLQTSRLDDQRCVLPAYFTTQVNFSPFFFVFASSLYHVEC